METKETLDQIKSQKFVEENKIDVNATLFEKESIFLTQAGNDDNINDLLTENTIQGKNARYLKTKIIENFSNYKFIGDARLELSVNRSSGVEKSMGGTKRKFRSHVLGSDLRKKRINMEDANALREKSDAISEQLDAAIDNLSMKEFAQVFNSMDLAKIDLSTDEKVIKSGERMIHLKTMLRNSSVIDNRYISAEKLELVRLLVDYYNARINLITEPEYASRYNSELKVDEISRTDVWPTRLTNLINDCRDMALRLQDFRVAAKADEAFRVDLVDEAIKKNIQADVNPEEHKIKEVQYDDLDVMRTKKDRKDVLSEAAEKIGNSNGMLFKETCDEIKHSYDFATEMFYIGIKNLSWTHFRYFGLTRDANDAFLDYFRSMGGGYKNDDFQQELYKKAIKEGKKYINRVLPGGYKKAMDSSDQKELDKRMKEVIKITGGYLEVPKDEASRLKVSRNPYYKKFYSWVNKKDDAVFVHPPIAGDVKDIDKGIPNLRIALSAIAYDSTDTIMNSIVDNMDGTVTVRFYEREKENPAQARPVYVKVDKTLPDLVGIDNKDQASLWVRLIEKAYAAQYGSGKYDGASNELGIIMERLTFSHTDDIFKKGFSISQIYCEELDDSLSANPEEVRASMDKAVKECRKKYDTFTPSVIQVMDYATEKAYLKNEDREYAEKYLVSTVGLNMALFSGECTKTANAAVEDFREMLGNALFVSGSYREDGLDKERKKALEARGLKFDYAYQVLEISEFEDGTKCVVLRDPYMVSGTEYSKDKKPQKKSAVASNYGCFAMEINDFMNCFNKVVG